jgi:hypothetical protein
MSWRDPSEREHIMSKIDYLLNYYPFEDDVMDAVERAAQRQADTSWPEYKRRFSVPEPKVFEPKDSKPVEILDLVPLDYEDTVVYHQPMACALDSNIQLHIATLAAVLPEKRIIGVGNPGQPGHGYGKLSLKNAAKVWQGNLHPVVAGTLEYLDDQLLSSASHAGESYGADKAAASAEMAGIYDHNVVSTVMVEPVSVVKSGLIKMGLTFQSTSKYADKYLTPLRQVSRTFKSAESLKESSLGYAIGLARLSNLAIGNALGKEGFEGRVAKGLLQNPGMNTGIAWGTASEFDKHNERSKIVDSLCRDFGNDRVTPLTLEGQTHAMNLDIFLNAAIIAQLLKRTAPR